MICRGRMWAPLLLFAFSSMVCQFWSVWVAFNIQLEPHQKIESYTVKPSSHWKADVNGSELPHANVQQQTGQPLLDAAVRWEERASPSPATMLGTGRGTTLNATTEGRRSLSTIEGRRTYFDSIATAQGFDPLLSSNWYSSYNEINRRKVSFIPPACLPMYSYALFPSARLSFISSINILNFAYIGDQIYIETLPWR